MYYSDSKMDLSKLYESLSPLNYFDTMEQRTSWVTYGQVYKDIHDVLGHTMTNMELLMQTPYSLTGLLKKGTRLSVEALKRSLVGYFNRMSAAGEYNYCSDDLAYLIFNLQRQQDNTKLIVSGM